MAAGTLVTIGTARTIGVEYRGNTGRVVGATKGFILVKLAGDLTVGFRPTELEVTA